MSQSLPDRGDFKFGKKNKNDNSKIKACDYGRAA